MAGSRMSLPLVAFQWLAESAWVYLTLLFATTLLGSGIAFSPAAVLAPCGLAIVATMLLGCGMGLVSSAVSSWGGTGSPRQGSRFAWLRRHPTLVTSTAAVAIVALHLLLGAVCLMAVLWWDWVPEASPMDLSWIGLMSEEAEGSAGGLAAVGWTVALGVALWWRGSCLARDENDFPQLGSRALWGTALLVGLMFLARRAPLNREIVSWWLAAYLLFSLMALAASRLEMALAHRFGAVDTGWRWRSTGMALMLLLAGFGTTYLLLAQLGEVAAWLRDWLVNGFFPFLLEVLRWIGQFFEPDKTPPVLPTEPQPEIEKLPRERELLIPPEWLREFFRWLFHLSWIGLILYAIYQWVKQWLGDRGRPATGAAAR